MKMIMVILSLMTMTSASFASSECGSFAEGAASGAGGVLLERNPGYLQLLYQIDTQFDRSCDVLKSAINKFETANQVQCDTSHIHSRKYGSYMFSGVRVKGAYACSNGAKVMFKMKFKNNEDGEQTLHLQSLDFE